MTIDYENKTRTVLGQDWDRVRDIMINLSELSDFKLSLNGSLLVFDNTTSTNNNSTQFYITKDYENKCSFTSINALYEPVHGYLAVTVCVLGTFFNMMNILVLTHKDMRTNPINLLLTGIAVADMMVMVEYIPFAIHMYLIQGRTLEEKFSYNWGLFLLFHVNFSMILHTVSIWYTLVLAVWRLIMIKFHTMAVTHCTMHRCCVLLVLGYVVPLVLTIPNFLAMSVNETTLTLNNSSNQTLHSITWSPLAESHNRLLYKLNVWFYSFFLKLVPCTLLSIITCLLIRALVEFSSRSMPSHVLENNTSRSFNDKSSIYKEKSSMVIEEVRSNCHSEEVKINSNRDDGIKSDPVEEVLSCSRGDKVHGDNGDDVDDVHSTGTGEHVLSAVGDQLIISDPYEVISSQSEIKGSISNSRYGSWLTVSSERSISRCGNKKHADALMTRQDPTRQSMISHIKVRKIRTDRTTRLLIAILCLFLISEFPQGIMGILSGILGNEFFIHCYTPLGELMDMLVLTNCMVNFILYCTMSRQFRITFRKIFGIQKSSLCVRNTNSGKHQSPEENVLTEKYLLIPLHGKNIKTNIVISQINENKV